MPAATPVGQRGWARSFELSLDNSSWTQFAGRGGLELLPYTFGRTRPVNPADSGTVQVTSKAIGTTEFALSAEGVVTSENSAFIMALVEPQVVYVRFSDEKQASGVAYSLARGIGVATITFDASAERRWALVVNVDRQVTHGNFT